MEIEAGTEATPDGRLLTEVLRDIIWKWGEMIIGDQNIIEFVTGIISYYKEYLCNSYSE